MHIKTSRFHMLFCENFIQTWGQNSQPKQTALFTWGHRRDATTDANAGLGRWKTHDFRRFFKLDSIQKVAFHNIAASIRYFEPPELTNARNLCKHRRVMQAPSLYSESNGPSQMDPEYVVKHLVSCYLLCV